MTTFRSVNTSLGSDMYSRNGEDTTPTTPRPSTAPSIQPQIPNRMDDATTPTRANFAASALANQRPLPAEPFPAAVSMPESQSDQNLLHRGNSQYSATSRDSDDVDMNGSEEGDEGSDDESVNADGTRTKKKKSQRFYCNDYPPCHLSFTRSEHLARHIRKHTGERPFQCHCSRRFSRLDNLRQHAQTVHVNEEIPQDSLAATGTRFQRQVRTERVRPPGGNRSRASTAGSQTQARGHHRNSLSASSIVSTGSYTSRDDVRRRPPPLQMAAGSRLSGEFGQQPGSPYQFRPHSPGGFSTPTSATFSTGQNSPRWGSAIQSPITSHSRTQSIYEGHRTPGRRLSVPSAGNPFQSPHGGAYGPPAMNTFSPTPSQLTSPTTSTAGSTFSRRESISNQADEAWRRRTWGPDTNSNLASRLQYVTTPNYYSNGPPIQPPVVPSNAPPLGQSNSMRLPGIESFDPIPRPTTPVRRQPSPMVIDTPSRAPEPHREERPTSQHWGEVSRGFNRLDLSQNTPHTDAASSWASDAHRAVQAQAEQARAQPPPQAVRFEESPYSARSQQNAYHHQSAPPVTPKEQKRHGWYHGPVTPSAVQHPPIDPRLQRTSPEDSSSSEGVPGTPSSATVGEFNPSIMHSNGYVENRNGVAPVPDHRILPSNAPNGYPAYTHASNETMYTYSHQHPPQTPQHRGAPKGNSNMSPLDTLVAVATNQGHDVAF